MKTIYLKTLNRLKECPTLKHIDKDRGQIDAYEQRPAVQFPCALISISLPKRKNITKTIQVCQCSVTVRLAFERFAEASNITSQNRLNIALQYYDAIDEVESLLQGYSDSEMNAWECTSAIEEQRPDFDVIRLTFSTAFKKTI